MRREKDSLGEMSLPDGAYFGIQTERARQNFDISGHTIEEYPRYIWSIASIKKVAALDPEIADAICMAAQEIRDGKFRGAFPIDVFHGGGGTSTNMNLN